MGLSNDTIRTVGSGVTITAGLVGVIWYIAGLDARIRRLEEQVHILTVAPTIASTASNAIPVANPIAEMCADLARKAVTEASLTGSINAQLEAERLISDFGCEAVGKR